MVLQRPWVQPSEVKTYTEYPSVKSRDDAKVAVDISRAEQYIIAFTNNDFIECEEIPAGVKTAVISIPLRFMQTAGEVASLADIENTAKLIAETVGGGLC